MHPKQACVPSPPLDSGQVLLLESGSCSRSLEPRSRLSVETEAQVGGVDLEPSNSSPDLGFVWQSGRESLCITGVIPMPALVLPEFPSTSENRCARSPLARQQAVCIYTRQARAGMFWFWPPRACHIKAQNFSLGEGWYFTRLWGTWSFFTSHLSSANSTRSVASSQTLFRGVPLEDICIATGCSSLHTFIRFYNLDLDTAPCCQVLSAWTVPKAS